MLATTIQITNNPPHTTTPKQQTPKPAAQANHHHTGDRRQHGVEREPDSVSAYTLIPNPKHAPTPTTPQQGSKHMRAQENNQHTNHTGQHTDRSPQNGLPRKEVIQPHLPVRLPCYDFVPIANPTFDHSPRKTVRPWASGVTNFRDVTGGVYKARERIHRSVADLRLLATPPSWGRVADPNPN